jgi:hypothetical protein
MSILALISRGIPEFSKKNNEIFKFVMISRDVIRNGLLLKSMRIWTRMSTLLTILDKNEHFYDLPVCKLLRAIGVSPQKHKPAISQAYR